MPDSSDCVVVPAQQKAVPQFSRDQSEWGLMRSRQTCTKLMGASASQYSDPGPKPGRSQRGVYQ